MKPSIALNGSPLPETQQTEGTRYSWKGLLLGKDERNFSINARLLLRDGYAYPVATASWSPSLDGPAAVHLFLCGVNNPRIPGWSFTPLSGALKDLEGMEGALRSECPTWAAQRSFVKANALTTASWPPAAIPGYLADRPDDLLVFYFSGRSGQRVRRDLTFLVNDQEITWEELRPLLAMPSQVLVLLDCCHSGAAVEFERGAVDQAKSDRFHLLTSCAANEVSMETSRGGLFSPALVLGLSKADSSGDGVVTLSELADYVRYNCGDRQHPQFWSSRTEPLALTRASGVMPEDSRAASWYVQLQTLREDYGTALNVLNKAGRRMYDLAPSVRRDGEALLNRKSELKLTPEQVRFIQERIEFVQRVLTSVNGKFEPPSEAPANDIRDVSAFLTEAQRLLEDCRSLQATAERLAKRVSGCGNTKILPRRSVKASTE